MTAGNSHLMESVLNSWLNDNHITVDMIIFCLGAVGRHIDCYLSILLDSGVFYELQVSKLISQRH